MKKLRYILILLLFPLFSRGQSIYITGVDTVCNGSPVYFTAVDSGVSTPYYQWSINGVIIPDADSAIFMSSSLTNGDTIACLLTDSTHASIIAYSNGIFITVLPVPSAGIISGSDTMVCVGSTITLYDTITAGKWSVSNNYASVDYGIVTGISSMQGEDGYAPPSADSIYYIVTNTYCSDTATKIILIEPQPMAGGLYLGDPFDYISSLCVGEALLINGGDGPNGTMYLTNGNISVTYIGGGEALEGVSTGADYVFCVTSNFCGSDTAGQIFTVDPLPIISSITTSSSNVCVGSTITFSGSTTGFPEWTASNSNASVNYLIGQATGVLPGLDTIILQASNACGYITDSVIINVDQPQPIIGVDSLCKRTEIQFFDSTKSGAWSSNNPSVASIDISGDVYGISGGPAIITYSLNGCFETQFVFISTCENDINIYPNPAQDEVTIYSFDNIYTGYYFINAIGQKVMQGPLAGPFTTVNVELLATGFYSIIITGSQGSQVGKFVKD